MSAKTRYEKPMVSVDGSREVSCALPAPPLASPHSRIVPAPTAARAWAAPSVCAPAPTASRAMAAPAFARAWAAPSTCAPAPAR